MGQLGNGAHFGRERVRKKDKVLWGQRVHNILDVSPLNDEQSLVSMMIVWDNV